MKLLVALPGIIGAVVALGFAIVITSVFDLSSLADTGIWVVAGIIAACYLAAAVGMNRFASEF